MRTGVVVAGGFSTRFGETDKALADLGGRPMVRRVADRLLAATDALVVNCRPDQRPALASALSGLDPTFAEDEVPDRGPVAGVAAGLRAAPSAYAAVVACDMPLLDPDAVAYLFERADGRDAAVPRVDGRPQPTHAVYRADAMAAACEAALAAGERRVVAPLSDIDWVPVAAEAVARRASLSTFENVNTPADLAAAAEKL